MRLRGFVMGYKEYNNESGNSFDSDEMNAAKQSLELLDVEIVRARSTLADCVKRVRRKG